MAKTLLILGGYGNSGKLIAELLLRESDSFVVIAGRNLDSAQKQVDRLNLAYKGDRATARQVDASSCSSLEAALIDVDMLVVASSTTAYTRQVWEAALQAKVDYLDIHANDSHREEVLESLQPTIESSNNTFVIEGGFHPGIAAALVRYAATQCENLQKANLYINISENWRKIAVQESTKEEFFRYMTEMKNDVYSNEKWEPQGWQVYREYDFGEPFHKRICVPMFLDELRSLPTSISSLEQVGMYITGFDAVSTYFTFPVSLGLSSICPKLTTRPIAKFFAWSLHTFAKPPFGTVMALEAEESPKEQPASSSDPPKLRVTVSHEDSYFMTAVPVVACLLQLLDDKANIPSGLHYQAHVVEPTRFVADLERLGLQVSIEKKA